MNDSRQFRSVEIERVLLVDLVYDRLLSDIVTGRFAPYQRLRVDAIASEFGVSRTPVREALLRLQMNRFVVVIHNSRTEVAAWSAAEMRDRLDVMGRMLSIVIADPRIEFDALVTGAESVLQSDDGDVAAFLMAAEEIVAYACNRIAGYTVSGLILPLRLFLTEKVLAGYGIDLAAGSAQRCASLLRALTAARLGNSALAAEALTVYVAALVTVIDHRSSDAPLLALPPISPDLRAVS